MMCSNKVGLPAHQNAHQYGPATLADLSECIAVASLESVRTFINCNDSLLAVQINTLKLIHRFYCQ